MPAIGITIGIIGGSGLYHLNKTSGEELRVETPFGAPSHTIYREPLGANTLLFLPRHGKGHTISPSELNSRANIFALKKLGATAVISISAVGSLRKEIAPGHFVLPDQYIDMTRGRPGTFFANGVVAQPHFAETPCATLREHLASAGDALGVTAHPGGTYVCMEGPQFSTRAESNLYRSWNLGKHAASVIGMTALPEARLAREARLCYQTVAMATDYDCWNEEKGDVSVEEIIKVLLANVDVSRRLVEKTVSGAFPACRSGCHDHMKNAVMTAEEAWPPSRREELKIILK